MHTGTTRGPSRWLTLEEATTFRTKLARELRTATLVGDTQDAGRLLSLMTTLDVTIAGQLDDQVELMPRTQLWDAAEAFGFVS